MAMSDPWLPFSHRDRMWLGNSIRGRNRSLRVLAWVAAHPWSNTRAAAKTFATTRNCIRDALNRLWVAGLVSRRGSGSGFSPHTWTVSSRGQAMLHVLGLSWAGWSDVPSGIDSAARHSRYRGVGEDDSISDLPS